MNTDQARAVLARLLRGIAPELDIASAPGAALLQDEMDLDSMDFLNLMTGLKDEIGIDVPERDYPMLASIDGFAAYVAERTEGDEAALVEG